jgi:hypothetical protein
MSDTVRWVCDWNGYVLIYCFLLLLIVQCKYIFLSFQVCFLFSYFKDNIVELQWIFITKLLL